MTESLPILDTALTDDQQTVLDTLLWHVTKEDGHGPVTTTWPSWDYVKGILGQQDISAQRVDAAAAAFPTLPRTRFPYSLVWRTSLGASDHIQPKERVGLTMAGLIRVDPDLADRLAAMIAAYAQMESELPLDPNGVRGATFRLNDTLSSYLTVASPLAGRVPMNVTSAAEILVHEYYPLAIDETGFVAMYDITLGNDRFAPFLTAPTAAEYVRAIAGLAAQHSPPAPTTPAPVARQLLGRRTREAVRDEISGTYLGKIEEMWQDEMFPPAVDPVPPLRGERITRFQGYLDLVDWTDPSHVARALRVFVQALDHLFHPEAYDLDPNWDPTPTIKRLKRLFGLDGYTLNDDGTITPPGNAIAPAILSNLTDPAVILGHLARIDTAIERQDPEQAIGSAKELVESTAKLVLTERGFPYSDKADDLPALVDRAMTALMVHPKNAKPGPDDIIKKILGATKTVTSGMAELRNNYGTGHGAGQTRSGLRIRHARLAINGAKLWCEFMIDTLGDSEAPWQMNPPTP